MKMLKQVILSCSIVAAAFSLSTSASVYMPVASASSADTIVSVDSSKWVADYHGHMRHRRSSHWDGPNWGPSSSSMESVFGGKKRKKLKIKKTDVGGGCNIVSGSSPFGWVKLFVVC